MEGRENREVQEAIAFFIEQLMDGDRELPVRLVRTSSSGLYVELTIKKDGE